MASDQCDAFGGRGFLFEFERPVSAEPPIFAAGVFNGDPHMLLEAAAPGGMSVLVRHTEGEPELASTTHPQADAAREELDR